jgi:D-alanyl-D-alanine carboxypeptidase
MANQKAPPHYMDSRLEDTLQAQLNQSLHFTGCMGVNVVITDSRNVSIQQTSKIVSQG